MKYLIVLMLIVSSQCFSQKNFSELPVSSDSMYGYAADNPLRLKKGDLENSIGYSIDFLRGLVTGDGEYLQVLDRRSVGDPGYKAPKIQLNNRFTGMPMNGKGGILDKYFFLTAKNDTLIIYVDVYNKSKLQIPKGLKYKER